MASEVARVRAQEQQAETPVRQVTSLAVVRLKRALDQFQSRFADDRVRQTLARADVIVCIRVTDLENAGITLVMNAKRVSVEACVNPRRPDVTLHMTTADLERMFDEGEYLALKILSTSVAFEGPVRKFLRVLPVLRGATPNGA